MIVFCLKSITRYLFSALDRIILTGYRALQLCYFFTSGKDEVKAWTIQVKGLI
jgi:ribosome-binding ATPase YchF (GTP1/OBG family)